jgi:DNA mismatch repair protein MutS
VAPGYKADLDETRRLRDAGRTTIAALQARYAQETGVAQLRVRHNNVLGYFIEVPARHAERLAAAPSGPFLHRQTLANAQRFVSAELSELEARIARAAADALRLEMEVFADLVAAVLAAGGQIAATARAAAELDVSSALGALAVEARYRRAEIDDGLAFEVQGGRHPVVEAALQRGAEPFVGNDCVLARGQRLWLLTGPNMAGKSTFLRQNALIAVLAQMGSFVPADRARIGIVDRLFSRVGAADDLARGRSTFMVEMIETAAILNQAGPRSLVILDEIGRGTATYDGLSIAWAVIEHLHDVNRCRGLFATHYHELTQLAARLDDLGCYAMRVKEWQGEVVFLHEVIAGAADRSYGIHVARLAGLPPAVVARAEQVLGRLETGEPASATARLAHDLPLFAAAERDAAAAAPFTAQRLAAKPSPAHPVPEVLAALEAVNPDELTPRQALDLLYALKALE